MARQRGEKATGGSWAAARRYSGVALSLVPTPWLIFISSSSALYLKNQALLEYRLEVLLPFARWFLLTFLTGVLLYFFSNPRPMRFFLWTYYLLGPFFMVFSFARAFQPSVPLLARLYQSTGGLALWPCLLLAGSLFLEHTRAARIPFRSFAVFGALLMALETHHFYSRLAPGEPPASDWNRIIGSDPGSPPLPNIYHLVMDGYQTELFELSLTDADRNSLGGFVFFPKNTSMYHTSLMSLASLFSGKPYRYDRTREAYIEEAFGAEDSLLQWLKQQGYATLAYVPADWSDWQGSHPFDHMAFLQSGVRGDLLEMNQAAFWNLWLFSNSAGPAREALLRLAWFSNLDEEDLNLLRQNRLFPQTTPVVSYLGFQKFLEKEEELPDSNRYTLIHVLIPHTPYKLRADCSYPPGRVTTGPWQQYRCALTLLEDFVHVLKSLGRFDKSLILVHGDHGDYFRVRNGDLRPTRSRSLRTVLLLKPCGATETQPFAVSDVELTLLDIGPSVRGYVKEAIGTAPPAGPHQNEWNSR